MTLLKCCNKSGKLFHISNMLPTYIRNFPVSTTMILKLLSSKGWRNKSTELWEFTLNTITLSNTKTNTFVMPSTGAFTTSCEKAAQQKHQQQARNTPPPCPPIICNNEYDLPSIKATIRYLHGVLGFSVKFMWLKGVKADNIITWPGVTKCNIKQYCPEVYKTVKVHMTHIRKNVRPTYQYKTNRTHCVALNNKFNNDTSDSLLA